MTGNLQVDWRLGWSSIMLKQSCLSLSVRSNNTVAISVTGFTDPLRDGQAELASMEMCVTSTITFFAEKNKTRSFYSYAGFVLANCVI